LTQSLALDSKAKPGAEFGPPPVYLVYVCAPTTSWRRLGPRLGFLSLKSKQACIDHNEKCMVHNQFRGPWGINDLGRKLCSQTRAAPAALAGEGDQKIGSGLGRKLKLRPVRDSHGNWMSWPFFSMVKILQ